MSAAIIKPNTTNNTHLNTTHIYCATRIYIPLLGTACWPSRPSRHASWGCRYESGIFELEETNYSSSLVLCWVCLDTECSAHCKAIVGLALSCVLFSVPSHITITLNHHTNDLSFFVSIYVSQALKKSVVDEIVTSENATHIDATGVDTGVEGTGVEGGEEGLERGGQGRGGLGRALMRSVGGEGGQEGRSSVSQGGSQAQTEEEYETLDLDAFLRTVGFEAD